MRKANQEFLAMQEKLYEAKKREILAAKDELFIQGTSYYVSNDGDDANDGKSPDTPWRTVNRVNKAWLKPGDGVLFRRGDLFRGPGIIAADGVSYGAYGYGEKPKFYGGTEDLAKVELWREYDKEEHIWVCEKPVSDPGTLVFNEGEFISRKLIPSYRNLQFVCRDDINRPFVMQEEMTENLDVFWEYDRTLVNGESKGEAFPVPEVGPHCMGKLYLRCDDGNPGTVFESIEMIARNVGVSVRQVNHITVDNLCLKYFCFGVGSGMVKGLHVSNCEIGWIGGNIQSYDGGDPNYPEGKRGSVTRFGNGIEVYGNCDDYQVSCCYIYQVYDAGASHQVNSPKKIVMQNIRYTDNLIENCVYGIEYFLDQIGEDQGSYMANVEMCGNYIRLSGYGWGQQRHNADTPALIKGWSYKNTARDFSICDNTFDRSAYRMLHLVAEKEEYCPTMRGNTYIQHIGGTLGQYGGNEIVEPDNLPFDESAEINLVQVFGEKEPEVYWISEE